MGFDETDPTARRRWEPEEQRRRDAEILRLIRAGDLSQREIAKRLGCTLGSVQHVIRREKKAQKRLAAEVDAVLATNDWLSADEVAGRPELWSRLNPLERYRLCHQPAALALVAAGHRLPPIHDDDHALCCIANGLDPDWTPELHGTVSHQGRRMSLTTGKPVIATALQCSPTLWSLHVRYVWDLFSGTHKQCASYGHGHQIRLEHRANACHPVAAWGQSPGLLMVPRVVR